jgi:hypothetical protein
MGNCQLQSIQRGDREYHVGTSVGTCSTTDLRKVNCQGRHRHPGMRRGRPSNPLLIPTPAAGGSHTASWVGSGRKIGNWSQALQSFRCHWSSLRTSLEFCPPRQQLAQSPSLADRITTSQPDLNCNGVPHVTPGYIRSSNSKIQVGRPQLLTI